MRWAFKRKYNKKNMQDNIINPEAGKQKWKEQNDSISNTETVGESGRIFVRNLSYSVSEDDIRNLFEKFGPLTEVNLPVDKITRRSKGFAFVTFVLPENAVAAFSELDGTTFQASFDLKKFAYCAL